MSIDYSFPGGGGAHLNSSGLEQDELKAELFNEYERLFIELVDTVNTHESKLSILDFNSGSLDLLGDVRVGSSSSNLLDIYSTTRFHGQPIQGIKAQYIETADTVGRNLEQVLKIGTVYPADFNATILKMSDGTTIEDAINNLQPDIKAIDVEYDNTTFSAYLLNLGQNLQEALQLIDGKLYEIEYRLSGLSYVNGTTRITDHNFVIWDSATNQQKILLDSTGNITLAGNIVLASNSTVDGIDISEHDHSGSSKGVKIDSKNVVYAAPLGGSGPIVANYVNEALEFLSSYLKKIYPTGNPPFPVKWANEWTGSDIEVSDSDSRTIAEAITNGGGFNYISVTPLDFSSWKGIEAFGLQANNDPNPSVVISNEYPYEGDIFVTNVKTGDLNSYLKIRGTTVRNRSDKDSIIVRNLQTPIITIYHADSIDGTWSNSSSTTDLEISNLIVNSPNPLTNDALCYWECKVRFKLSKTKYFKFISNNGVEASEIIKISTSGTGPSIESIDQTKYYINYTNVNVDNMYSGSTHYGTGKYSQTSLREGQYAKIRVEVKSTGLPISSVAIEAMSGTGKLFTGAPTYIAGQKNKISLTYINTLPNGNEVWEKDVAIGDILKNQNPSSGVFGILVYANNSLGSETSRLFNAETISIDQGVPAFSGSPTVNYPIDIPSGLTQKAYKSGQSKNNGLQFALTNFSGSTVDFCVFVSSYFNVTNPFVLGSGNVTKELSTTYVGESPLSNTITLNVLKVANGSSASLTFNALVDNTATAIETITVDSLSASSSIYRNCTKSPLVVATFDDELLQKPTFTLLEVVTGNTYSVPAGSISGTGNQWQFTITDAIYLGVADSLVRLNWNATNCSGIISTGTNDLFVHDLVAPVIADVVLTPVSIVGSRKVIFRKNSFDPLTFPNYTSNLKVRVNITEIAGRMNYVKCTVSELGINNQTLTEVSPNVFEYQANNIDVATSYYHLKVQIVAQDKAGNTTSAYSDSFASGLVSYDALGAADEYVLLSNPSTGILKDFKEANSANAVLYEVFDTEAAINYTASATEANNNNGKEAIILENKINTKLGNLLDNVYFISNAFNFSVNLKQNYLDLATRLPILVIMGFEANDVNRTVNNISNYSLINYSTSSGNNSRLEIYISSVGGVNGPWIKIEKPTTLKDDGLTIILPKVNELLVAAGAIEITTSFYLKLVLLGDIGNQGKYPRIDNINVIYYKP